MTLSCCNAKTASEMAVGDFNCFLCFILLFILFGSFSGKNACKMARMSEIIEIQQAESHLRFMHIYVIICLVVLKIGAGFTGYLLVTERNSRIFEDKESTWSLYGRELNFG